LNVTVLIPHKRGSRDEWLKDAVGSIPAGVPYIVLENDGELAAALNAGLEAAKTEWVIRLDDDNLLDRESIQKLLDAVWDVDVAYPDVTVVSPELRYMATRSPGEFCPNRLLVENYIDGGGALIRREKALEVGGYRDLAALEDWDLWVRMLRAGARFKWHPEARFFYRYGEGRNTITVSERDGLKAGIVGVEPDLAATFYSQETIAQIYWRCLLPSRVLPAQTVQHRPIVDASVDVVFPHHRGTAVWQFPGHHYERYSMAAMQERGIPCLVETDDNYLVRARYGRTHWVRDEPRRGFENSAPSYEIHRKVVGWCDGVIVTTDHLAKQYRKVTDAPVFVCPNQVDPADWLPGELPDWYDPNKTYVGLAASASHRGDLKLVERALEWAARARDVEVVLMGSAHMGYRWQFPHRYVPWATDLSVYRRLLRVLDVGLAPIVEDPWSACRSDLKVLEYSMAGAASVVSDATPYRNWADGEYVRKAKRFKISCGTIGSASRWLLHVRSMFCWSGRLRLIVGGG
jgi:glycosyltransferase involved in cell wall biosynthesis